MPTPEYIKRTAAQALQDSDTFHTENASLLGLRGDPAEYCRKLREGGPGPAVSDQGGPQRNVWASFQRRRTAKPKKTTPAITLIARSVTRPIHRRP